VFRRIDGDGNGKQDYWTADVAGFYAIPDADGNKLKFIDIATAKADAGRAEGLYKWEFGGAPVPKAGYLYKVMALDENGKPYRQDPDGDGKKTTNLSQWAYCAYPAQHNKDGVRTFIVNEEGVVYAKDTGGKPVEKWPGADPTTAGWTVTFE
jgi:hypothetical protein